MPLSALFLAICDSDKDTICQHSSPTDKYNTVAFPYDCRKHVQCNNIAFSEVKSVKDNKFYNPENGQAVMELSCATLKGTLQFVLCHRHAVD